MKLLIIQVSMPHSAGKLLVNAIYGLIPELYNKKIIGLWNDNFETYFENIIAIKSDNTNIDELIQKYNNKYKLVFICSQRPLMNTFIDKKYNNYNNVLIFNFFELANRKLIQIVDNIYNKVKNVLSDIELDKNKCIERLTLMNIRYEEIKNNPNSYVDDFFEIHGSCRNTKQVTIYGERCSGTNYLEQLLLLNFNVKITWNHGWKHFFGFNDLSNSDDVLFIGIVRNLYDWINSFYREKHHIQHLTQNIDTFLTHTFYSIKDNNEIMEDRNMETNEMYKNIFELRRVKNKFLIEKMPNLVKNYCIITYDDLTSNFIDIMNKLKDCGLEINPNIKFPLNITYYKTNKNVEFKKKENEISNEKIDNLITEDKELLFYENLLFSGVKSETLN